MASLFLWIFFFPKTEHNFGHTLTEKNLWYTFACLSLLKHGVDVYYMKKKVEKNKQFVMSNYRNGC